MRIGVEMFATQSDARHRGVGRFARHLAAGLAAVAPGRGHDLVFYAADGPPIEPFSIPDGPRATLRLLRPRPTLRETVARLVDDNPDALDALVLVNPLELIPGYDIPPHPGPGGPRLAAVVHDLIPLTFSEAYLRRWSPGFVRRYLWGLEHLRTYDVLLANSETTRSETVHVLDVPPGRVVIVGAAGNDRDPRFAFSPAMPGDEPVDRAAVARLGLDRPFILSVGASDLRKNLAGLVDAFALLPPGLRDTHQLAVTGHFDPAEAAALARRASGHGAAVAAAVVTTGRADDPTLRALYRRCAVFAFPSFYEGFGLPILEALACGAVVVAGRNSAQVEAAGDAALLVNAAEPAAIADGLARALTDPALARTLRDAGPARARTFSWDNVALRTLLALETVGQAPRLRPHAPTHGRPRIALFSPLSRDASGLGNDAADLVEALAAVATVDLFHDTGEVPRALFRVRSLGGACHDHRLFERLARLRPYDAVFYQTGRTPAHAFVYEQSRKHPGVVVLHDPSLDELVHAEAFVVHSSAAALLAERSVPGIAGRTFVVPQGVRVAPRPAQAADRADARDRLGLPVDALIVGQFGAIHPSKMNAEAVEAFASIAGSTLMMIVGDEADGGLARRRAEALGLSDRVRFWGRPGVEEWQTLAAAVDIGLCLRRPPAHGESSGTLPRLLGAGVATVVTDVDAFAEVPEGVVRKVPWATDGERGPEALRHALSGLASDPGARAALGLAAWEHARARHAWPVVAEAYARVIAACRKGRGDSEVVGVYRGPHTKRVGDLTPRGEP